MIKVLFVCLGNICRSPMAEFIFKNMIKEKGLENKFYVESAATSYEEIGNGMHYGAIHKLEEKGIPFSEHKARRITKEDYKKFDYIIGMEDKNIKDIFRIVGEDVENKIYKLLDFSSNPRNIADPWYTGNFEITYNDIIEGCTAFLEKVYLLNEFKENDELTNIKIENLKKSEIEFKNKSIEKSKINNTEIINSNLEKNSFSDIEFNNCNFSNTHFDNCSFIRCKFNNCKFTGCSFIESILINIEFTDSNMNYANLSMANIKNVSFRNTVLRNSYFQENKITNLTFKKADLTQAQFSRTSLNKVDLSDSTIEGISISCEDIKGAIINQFQAVDLLYLLGVKIK